MHFAGLIDLRVYLVVTVRASVQDQHTRLLIGLFHHIRKMVTVIFRERWAQNDQVIGALAQRLLYALPPDRLLDVVPGLGERPGMLRQMVRISFTIKNFH